MNRYDYVKYNNEAEQLQAKFKGWFSAMSVSVDDAIKCPRSRALVQTKLEEAYMWIGKGIRNDQIERNEGKFETQEERTNS